MDADQVGNWDVDKVDLNGDGDYIDKDEVNDQRSHNDVNEITGRDTDNDGTDDFTLVYDATGNLTDDGESYKYEYDAFYRLRFVKDQSGALLAEHRYNGLGHRIAEHVDTDDDGDVDVSDDWRNFAYDERWRITAHFLNADSSPTEEFVHHAAGLDGRAGSSYIDLVVLRNRDTTANGTFDERMYYCQNWRADVNAIVDDAGEMYEWVKYSAYGVPFALPGADTDSDGDCDATDVNQILAWTSYDVRGDVDLNGVLNLRDKALAQSRLEGLSMGRGVLSSVENRRGLAGYSYSDDCALYLVRFRALSAELGTWFARDPVSYADGLKLYEYVSSSPVWMVDPYGLFGGGSHGGGQSGLSSPLGVPSKGPSDEPGFPPPVDGRDCWELESTLDRCICYAFGDELKKCICRAEDEERIARSICYREMVKDSLKVMVAAGVAAGASAGAAGPVVAIGGSFFMLWDFRDCNKDAGKKAKREIKKCKKKNP